MSFRKTKASNRGHTAMNFATVPAVQAPRSQFDRSHRVTTTFDAGYLIPIMAEEALPGDTLACRVSSLVRMLTPIAPVMDNIYLDFFFFSIPNRLVWDNWVKFCGEQVDPGDSIDYSVPQFTSETVATGDLADYFGIPIGVSLDFNSLWHRAYNRVWNEWFRDEDLQDSLTVDMDDGPDTYADYIVKRRGKRHDYFSSCRPWTQKGDAVTLEMSGYMDVVPDDATSNPTFEVNSSSGRYLTSDIGFGARWSGSEGAIHTAYWDDPKLRGDISSATWWTINEMREAFQVQKLLERDARGGTRYTEIIRSHFQVVHPDASWRSEYLGGGSSRINIYPVAQTVAAANPVGELGAYGVGMADGIGFVKSFTEHCLVLGMVNVRADLMYSQGLPRQFSRRTRYDFYWPSLAMLGEQAVLNQEIYAQGTAADAQVFGFQERYSEYRYRQNVVSGLMRSEAAGSLDVWHLGLDFDSLPVLNNTFIQDDPPFDRVVAVQNEDHFKGDFYFDYKCARPMPVRSVPGLIDHF